MQITRALARRGFLRQSVMHKRLVPFCITVVQVGCAPAAPAPAEAPTRDCSAAVAVRADTSFDSGERQQQIGPRVVSRNVPQYPNELRSSFTEGRVVANLVIDTSGRVIPETALVTSKSHAAFGDAVCTWLRHEARFIPIVVSGRKYSVHMMSVPFDFALVR